MIFIFSEIVEDQKIAACGSSYRGARCFRNQRPSGPLVIARFTADMHPTVITDFSIGMHTAVIADFTVGMHATVVANFTRSMYPMVIAHFAGAVYPMVIPRLVVGAVAPGRG